MGQFSKTIIDHFQNPRNLGEFESCDLTIQVGDPMCGDKIQLTLDCDGDRVVRTAFKAYGCAPTLALGSVLTEVLLERPLESLEALDEREFNALLGGLKPSQKHVASLGRRVVAELVQRWPKQDA